MGRVPPAVDSCTYEKMRKANGARGSGSSQHLNGGTQPTSLAASDAATQECQEKAGSEPSVNRAGPSEAGPTSVPICGRPGGWRWGRRGAGLRVRGGGGGCGRGRVWMAVTGVGEAVRTQAGAAKARWESGSLRLERIQVAALLMIRTNITT